MTKTLTELIMESSAPWDNPYQGKDKKVLFVCSAGILRSATAARIYGKKYNTRACGSYGYALIPFSANLLLWADEIVFVNQENYEEVLDHFPAIVEKERKVLNIPDIHPHMHPLLIKAFEEQYEPI
jgi:predicted protein tyrosine phosphatase